MLENSGKPWVYPGACIDGEVCDLSDPEAGAAENTPSKW